MIAYLDGLPKEPSKEIDVTSYASFITEQNEKVKKLKKQPRYSMTKNQMVHSS